VLGFFSSLFRRNKMTDYERYLSKAKDVYDLERREKAWSRGHRV